MGPHAPTDDDDGSGSGSGGDDEEGSGGAAFRDEDARDPGGLADELSMLGNRLNGDTRQLIRDRERDAQLNRGLRHLSNAMLTTGK